MNLLSTSAAVSSRMWFKLLRAASLASVSLRLSFHHDALKDRPGLAIPFLCGFTVMGKKLAPRACGRGLLEQTIDPLDKELRIARADSDRLRVHDDEHSAGVGLVAILPVHPPRREPATVRKVGRGLKNCRRAGCDGGGLRGDYCAVMNQLDSALRGCPRPPLDPCPHRALPREVNLVSWAGPVVHQEVQELCVAVSRNYGSH